MSEQGSTPPPPEPSEGSAPPPQAPPPAGSYGSAPPPAAPNPYGAAPSYEQAPPSGPVTRPKSMDLAVTLMRVGAVISLISALSVLFLRDTIREAVTTSLEDAGTTADQGTVDAAVAIGTGTAIVFGLVGVALWLWMASANGKGRSWARILSTVFFALSVVSFLVGLAQAQAGLSLVLNVVSLLLGASIIFLLWKKESSEFYAASSTPRY